MASRHPAGAVGIDAVLLCLLREPLSLLKWTAWKIRRPHSIDFAFAGEYTPCHQEYYGYDEKKYPEGMLQRAAGWCKAVQGIRGKILSELSGW